MRRSFLIALALLASTPHLRAASVQDVRQHLSAGRFTLVAPFPAGGPVDMLARVLADGLARRYGQPAVVENLAGAAGNIGIDKVRRAKADGRTLLVVPAGNLTINPTLMKDFPFHIGRDFVPITMLAKAPNVLVAFPGSGIRTVNDLIAKAKAGPVRCRMRRLASAAACIWPASCSSSRRALSCCTWPTKARRPPSMTCSAARCR